MGQGLLLLCGRRHGEVAPQSSQQKFAICLHGEELLRHGSLLLKWREGRASGKAGGGLRLGGMKVERLTLKSNRKLASAEASSAGNSQTHVTSLLNMCMCYRYTSTSYSQNSTLKKVKGIAAFVIKPFNQHLNKTDEAHLELLMHLYNRINRSTDSEESISAHAGAQEQSNYHNNTSLSLLWPLTAGSCCASLLHPCLQAPEAAL